MFFLYLLVTQNKVTSAYTFYIQKTHFSRQRREDAFLEMQSRVATRGNFGRDKITITSLIPSAFSRWIQLITVPKPPSQE